MSGLIRPSSSLMEVCEANPLTMTHLDSQNCQGALLNTGVSGLTGCVTVVGFDMTDFLIDCEISDECDPDFYSNEYDGFAIVF